MPDPVTLAHHIAAAAGSQPSATALRAGQRDWSYQALLEQACALADPLRQPTPVSIVALAGDSATLALGAAACSAAGIACWPLDPATPPARWASWAALGGPAVRRLERLPAPTAAGTPPPCAPRGPALIIGTSGSEGLPKAVMLSHANLDAAARASNERLPLGPGDTWLDCLPLFHIGGQSILWRCFRAGARVLLHDGFAAAAVRRDLDSEAVTHISLVPAMLAALLDLDPMPPRHLRCALVGGAALSQPLYDRAHQAGWPLFPTYGMSETAAQVCTRPPGATPWHEGEVGLPLPGGEIAVDSAGRLRLRGPQVMLGYLNPGLHPGQGLDDGWFTSGDLGRLAPDGQVTILGRADDMLISGGRNIHPSEVEAGLAGCPGLADVAVTGLPDPVWGDTLVALVVGPVSDDALEAWSRARLPAAARPRRIVRLPGLPRNAMGKLERGVLRRLAAGSPE